MKNKKTLSRKLELLIKKAIGFSGYVEIEDISETEQEIYGTSEKYYDNCNESVHSKMDP